MASVIQVLHSKMQALFLQTETIHSAPSDGAEVGRSGHVRCSKSSIEQGLKLRQVPELPFHLYNEYNDHI